MPDKLNDLFSLTIWVACYLALCLLIIPIFSETKRRPRK